MEAMKLKLIVVVIMATLSVQTVVAADAPAPSPDSGATTFIPAVLVSIVAAVVGLLFSMSSI
uniref:Uncharacterized protein n=1 Tax=Kalanchoe fedtschenkoi TaxID=63787 RepID=A0A7N1A6J2_KALFE